MHTNSEYSEYVYYKDNHFIWANTWHHTVCFIAVQNIRCLQSQSSEYVYYIDVHVHWFHNWRSWCLQHRVSVSRGDKKAAEWKELKQQSFPGMINSKPGARRYLLGPFPLQWASDTVEPCLYIGDIGGFLGNRQQRASNQTFLQIFHLIFLFQIPHYSSPGLWLFSDPNCHQNQDSKDKKLTKQVC